MWLLSLLASAFRLRHEKIQRSSRHWHGRTASQEQGQLVRQRFRSYFGLTKGLWGHSRPLQTPENQERATLRSKCPAQRPLLSVDLFQPLILAADFVWRYCHLALRETLYQFETSAPLIV